VAGLVLVAGPAGVPRLSLLRRTIVVARVPAQPPCMGPAAHRPRCQMVIEEQERCYFKAEGTGDAAAHPAPHSRTQRFADDS
jgi:hypothetical protein